MPLLIGTHSGGFHADDVLGVALRREFVGREASVLRSRKLDALSRCDLVVDVGAEFDPAGRRVDHRNAEDEGPLSSAGMVLDWLQSEEDCPAGLAKQLRHELVDYADAVDNGRRSPDGDAPRFTSMVGAFPNDAGSDRAAGVPVEAAAAMPGGGREAGEEAALVAPLDVGGAAAEEPRCRRLDLPAAGTRPSMLGWARARPAGACGPVWGRCGPPACRRGLRGAEVGAEFRSGADRQGRLPWRRASCREFRTDRLVAAGLQNPSHVSRAPKAAGQRRLRTLKGDRARLRAPADAVPPGRRRLQSDDQVLRGLLAEQRRRQLRERRERC